MFKIDYDNTMGDGMIKPGEYEVVVNSAKEDVTMGGTVHISIDLVVRNDIEQPYKNAHIWVKIWKGKETGIYNSAIINTIGMALSIPNGKNFASLDDLLADLEKKVCKVKVKHEEYNGKTNVKVASWLKTGLSTCNHTWEKGRNNERATSGFGQEVPLNDCPF